MICIKCNQPQIKFGSYKCKNCRDLYHLKWRTENRDHVNEKSKTWVNENKELRKQVVKKSEFKDRDGHLAKRRKLYAEGRRRKYYKGNSLVKTEAKNRRRARLVNVISEKYSAKAIFEKFNYICAYCSNPATDLDHVIPISRGGPDTESNLVAACKSCNCSKGNKTLEEWIIMKLG